MSSLIAARLPARTAGEAMVTGRRYGGTAALAAGIVDAVTATGVTEAGEAERAIQTAADDIARPLTDKACPALGVIKSRLHAQTVAALLTAKPTSG
jgi:enoyl-CoA hydratase/carnithine racemase